MLNLPEWAKKTILLLAWLVAGLAAVSQLYVGEPGAAGLALVVFVAVSIVIATPAKKLLFPGGGGVEFPDLTEEMLAEMEDRIAGDREVLAREIQAPIQAQMRKLEKRQAVAEERVPRWLLDLVIDLTFDQVEAAGALIGAVEDLWPLDLSVLFHVIQSRSEPGGDTARPSPPPKMTSGTFEEHLGRLRRAGLLESYEKAKHAPGEFEVVLSRHLVKGTVFLLPYISSRFRWLGSIGAELPQIRGEEPSQGAKPSA